VSATTLVASTNAICPAEAEVVVFVKTIASGDRPQTRVNSAPGLNRPIVAPTE